MNCKRKSICFTGSILLVLLHVIASFAEATPIQWPQASGGNGHFYEFFGSENLLWSQAKTAAESKTFLGRHGFLATITSSAENQFIASHMGAPDYWIGLTDSELFGGSESQGKADPFHQGWVWVTGEPVAYVNWRSGEPNNEFNNEDGVEIYGSERTPTSNWLGLWNDENNSSTQGYIVEYAPEPSSLIMLAIGGLVAGGAAMRHQRSAQGAGGRFRRIAARGRRSA